MPHTIFNLAEVADYLHLKTEDLEWLVKHREIPFRMQGASPMFMKKEVDAWATRRILSLKKDDLTAYHKTTTAKAHDLSQQHALIPELMQEGLINPELHAKTMPSIIRAMVEMANNSSLVIYPDELLESVTDREKMRSTALPGGFALLHPAHHDPYMFEDSFIVMGRTLQSIPFHAPDGLTTDIFFLVCCQHDRIHLHVLARLCMMCQHSSLILDLREAKTASEMYEALLLSEQSIIKANNR